MLCVIFAILGPQATPEHWPLAEMACLGPNSVNLNRPEMIISVNRVNLSHNHSIETLCNIHSLKMCLFATTTTTATTRTSGQVSSAKIVNTHTLTHLIYSRWPTNIHIATHYTKKDICSCSCSCNWRPMCA